MAVEKLLRGTMVFGVLLIGGIVVGSQFKDRFITTGPEARLERAIESRVERTLERAIGEVEAAADPSDDTADGLEDRWNDADSRVAIDARAGQNGQIAVDLPGGFGLKLPMGDKALSSGFEVGGVKAYPGAKLLDMQVRVRDRRGGRERSLISMDFEAPGDAAGIASYYEDGIRRAGGKVRRSGDRLVGSTAEGKEFSLSLRSRGDTTRGTFRIRETG
jgi:hypothetical protein